MVVTSAPIRFNIAHFRIELRRSSSILKNDLKSYTDQLQKRIEQKPYESSRKVELKKQIEILIPNLELQDKRALSDAELYELRTRLNDQKSSLEQYLKTSQLSPDEVRQIKRIKSKIEKLLKEPRNEAEKEIKPTEASDRLSKHENITREQILNGKEKREPFSYERDLRLDELARRSAEKSEKKESLPRSQNLLPASGLLSSITDAFITRELMRSINTTPSISTLTIQNLVSGLNAELSRLISQPKTDFTCRIVYEEFQHSFRIQISGKLSEAEIVKSTHQIVAEKPAEMLPLLSEAAAKLIEKNPENKTEIIRLVAEIVNSKPSTPTSIKEEEIIRATVSELESQQPKSVNLNNQYEVKLEIATSILQNLTPAAIPALLAEYKHIAVTNNLIATKVLAPAILGLAQNIIHRTNEVSKINMVGKNNSRPDIPTLIVLANKNKLPAQLDFNTARALLELVKEAQDCMKLAGVKNLDRAMKRIEAAESRRKKVTNPSSVQKPVRTKSEPSLGKIVKARQALQELVSTAESANLSIPKTLYYVIGNIYAGLAGITALPQKRTILPFEAVNNLEETRANSSLKRVLAALEADIAKAVGRDPSTQAKRLALAAEILLYGIIMRKVKADINRVDEIIRAIKKHKKLLKGLLDNIKNGNEEDTVNAIDNLILQADKLSYHKGGFDEADLNQALETILKMENEPKEFLPKTPDVYTMAA